MQESDSTQIAKSAHRRVKASTTLNRRYVTRPSQNEKIDEPVAIMVEKSPKISRFNTKPQQQNPVGIKISVSSPANSKKTEEVSKAQVHPLQEKANNKMKSKLEKKNTTQSNKMTAKEMKDKAIAKALMQASAVKPEKKSMKSMSKSGKARFGFGHVMLALGCTAIAVFAIVYFVNLNMPDISLKVAAMQTGINASYPSYIPRDYVVSSILSEDQKIVLEFKNAESGDSFKLTEEASSLDSNAVLNNYVKLNYKDNYTVVREQGLTIYISGSDAVWVSGGVIYEIDANGNSLTNKQIKSIATSL